MSTVLSSSTSTAWWVVMCNYKKNVLFIGGEQYAMIRGDHVVDI